MTQHLGRKTPNPPPAGVTRGPGRHGSSGSSSGSFAICLALLRFRLFFSPFFDLSLRFDVSDLIFFSVVGLWRLAGLLGVMCLVRADGAR